MVKYIKKWHDSDDKYANGTVLVIGRNEFIPEGWYEIRMYDDLKCECGTWTIYGKKAPLHWHSDWCQLYQKK